MRAQKPAPASRHVRHEFATRDTEATLAAMVENAYVKHTPVLTGGMGRDEMREAGLESARKALDPRLPANAQIKRADRAQ